MMKLKTNRYAGQHMLYILAAIINCFFLTEGAKAQNQKDSIQIIIESKGKTALDSVKLYLWENYTVGADKLGITRTSPLRNNSTARFSLPILKDYGIFRIQTFKNKVEYYSIFFMIKNGDSVLIKIDSNRYTFAGKGAQKMQIAYELDQLHDKYRKQYYDINSPSAEIPQSKSTFWGTANEFLNKPLDSLLNEKLVYLQKYKTKLFHEDYEWLKANTITYDYFQRFDHFNKQQAFGIATDSTKKNLFTEMFNRKLFGLYPKGVTDSVLVKTPDFAHYLLWKWRIATKLDKNFFDKYSDITKYALILPEVGREPFITSYLLLKGINKLEYSFVDAAMKYVKTPTYFTFLSGLRDNVRIGQAAYNFELEDVNGQRVRLSDFKGRIVFMDFWYTGCKWCKVYYQETLKAVEKHFENSKEIVFLSVCIDSNREQWMNSVNGNSYTGAEVVNLYTQGKGSDHPLIRNYNIMGYPTQIIIDRNMRNFNIDNGIQKLSEVDLIKYLESAIKKPINTVND